MLPIRFSIVITTYNRVELLKRAINTALCQTISCEVIVIDDCSTDDTETYVKSLMSTLQKKQDKILVYHRNDRNQGHAKTVNIGVEKATGDWIKLVDDDDYLAPNCIEEIEKAIALHPESVICSFQAAQVDENELELTITRKSGPGQIFYVPQEDIHYGMLLEMIPFGTPIQVAFEKAAFIKSGGWDSSLDTNFDDADSWLKIAQFGDAIFINKCLGYRTLWLGAYNYKFSIEERCLTNMLIKEKIYKLVATKYDNQIPSLSEINAYLKLHWGLVAMKQAKILTAMKLMLPAMFSQMAWYLILTRSKNTPYPEKINPKNSMKFQLTVPDDYSLKEIQYLRFFLKQKGLLLALQQGKIITAINILQLLISDFINKYSQKTQIKDRQTQITNNVLVVKKIAKKLRIKNNYWDEQSKYIKLRWSLLVLKQGQISNAFKIVVPAIFSVATWRLLGKIAKLKIDNNQYQTSLIRKIVLIND